MDIILSCIMLSYTASYYIVSYKCFYHIVLHHIITYIMPKLYYIIPYYITLNLFISHYIMAI